MGLKCMDFMVMREAFQLLLDQMFMFFTCTPKLKYTVNTVSIAVWKECTLFDIETSLPRNGFNIKDSSET